MYPSTAALGNILRGGGTYIQVPQVTLFHSNHTQHTYVYCNLLHRKEADTILQLGYIKYKSALISFKVTAE